jgi:A/G-specific adenine glycosylase
MPKKSWKLRVDFSSKNDSKNTAQHLQDEESQMRGSIPQPREIAQPLLTWYDRHARSLPWRDNPNPYRVWVSEIMLQQTRVETVVPYFERWMQRFPDLTALAAATEQEVLQTWEGLGYYSRARNLHRAAQRIVEQHGGEIPPEREALEKLPGIGRYTAGAISSIAFGHDEPALDANIRRVLARVFNVDIPARSPAGEKLLWALAERTIPPGQAGDYNQALMDLGSSICTPRAPACLICPLTDLCDARALGVQEARPILEAKQAVPHYTVTAAVIQHKTQVLIAKRPSEGLLGGLWEFPGGKLENEETLPEGLQREIREELGVEIRVGEPFGVYRHGYTHFKVTLHAFCCSVAVGEPRALHASEIRWVEPSFLQNFPMGKIDRQIARRILEQQGCEKRVI